MFLPCSTASTDKKTVFIHGFVLGRCCATWKKTCLYTVLSFMDKVVFIHSFFGSARNAALRRLLPASCSLLLFPPLVRTAWFPPLAPTDLSHGFSTILAKHKTDQTEPPKHNTHLVFFDFIPVGSSKSFRLVTIQFSRCLFLNVLNIFNRLSIFHFFSQNI